MFSGDQLGGQPPHLGPCALERGNLIIEQRSHQNIIRCTCHDQLLTYMYAMQSQRLIVN